MSLRVLGGKLPVVRVFVARLALLRSAFETRCVFRCGLVTVPADNCAVSSQQGEFRSAVIEPVDVRPRLGIVASLAPEWSSIGALPRHAVIEFALVRILVACGACPVFKFKGKNLVGAAGRTQLVAIDACDCGVRASQRKTRVAVLGDCERGAVEIHHGVASFAFVVVRCGGELIVMGVVVTVPARSKFNFVNGVLARRNMTLPAFNRDVLALEGIIRTVVFLHPEE